MNSEGRFETVEEIKLELERLNIKLQDIALETGISHSMLYHSLSGKKNKGLSKYAQNFFCYYIRCKNLESSINSNKI